MNRWISMFTAAMCFAAVTHAQQQEPKRECFSQGLELPENRYAPIYNAPAAIDLQDQTFDVWASFTYWNVSQQNMAAAYVAPVSAVTAADVVPGSVVAMGTNWTPGFKVGAAFNTNYDGWVGSAEYTWVRSSTSVSASNNTGNPSFDFIGSLELFSSDSLFDITTIRSQWTMHLDQIDAVFSRPYYQGTRVTMTPFAGLRSLFIRQRQTGNATIAGASNLVVLNSHAWSIGPVGGISGHWFLGQGFRFEGSMSGSLLYMQYTKLSYNYTPAGEFSAKATYPTLNTIRPTMEMGLGVGWGSYLCDQSYFIDFSAEYDFNYYWAQNMARLIPPQQVLFDTNTIGSLMMHGLVLTGRFDF